LKSNGQHSKQIWNKNSVIERNNLMNMNSKVLAKSNASRLIFIRDHYKAISSSLDIGLELANELKNIEIGPKLPLVANKILHELLEENLIKDDYLGEIYSIKNIGILFEPELKIDFVSLCRKYSRDSNFIIEHQGDIDDENLYFLTKENGKKIELTDLNYTVL